MGVILEEPKHKVLDPSPSLKTTGECPPPPTHTLWEVVVDPARSLAPTSAAAARLPTATGVSADSNSLWLARKCSRSSISTTGGDCSAASHSPCSLKLHGP